jgi:citrate synthase
VLLDGWLIGDREVLLLQPKTTAQSYWFLQMMLQQGGVKIWRPRQVILCPCKAKVILSSQQIYVGPGKRDYEPVEERSEGLAKGPVPVPHSG